MVKKVLTKSKNKFEVIQVGKIWAVKNNNQSKVILYTENKSEAAKIVKDLMEA